MGHKVFNGGKVPVLENTVGMLIPESDIITDLAIEVGGSRGAQLIPSDPFEAAKMRAFIAKVDKVTANYFFAVYTRFTNEEKVDKFMTESLALWEKVCTDANGKFLMGTDDLTLADTHLGGMWESAY